MSDAKNGWLPIESAPKDGRKIMIWLGGDRQEAVIAFYRLNSIYGETWDFEDGHTVSLDDDVRWWQPALKGPFE